LAQSHREDEKRIRKKKRYGVLAQSHREDEGGIRRIKK